MIEICLSCEACQTNRPGGCNGECLCTDTGKDIKEQVAKRECPRKLFGPSGATATIPLVKSKTSAPCSTCGKIVNGAIGLAKVGAQMIGIPIDQAPRKVEAARLRVCVPCDFNRGGICSKCSCVIAAKVKLASEACPENFWAD